MTKKPALRQEDCSVTGQVGKKGGKGWLKEESGRTLQIEPGVENVGHNEKEKN